MFEPARQWDRDKFIKAYRHALKSRSGKQWSVTGGRGTAWGWIHITALPRNGGSCMDDATRAELGKLLGMGGPAHPQGESVPASTDYRLEYLERCQGQSVTKPATPYWD